MLRRNGKGSPWSWAQALLAQAQRLQINSTDANDTIIDHHEAALALERDQVLTRLDPNVKPTRFRFPLVSDEELAYLRQVNNVIRRGRVTRIAACPEKNAVKVEFNGGEPWLVDHRTVFVHCTSPGPFNNHKASSPFVSEHQINLEFLFAPPVPISMSCLAALESQRRKKRLDLTFGRELFGKDATETDVLHGMIKAYDLTRLGCMSSSQTLSHLSPLQTLASFIAVYDQDPKVGYQWMCKNRLSFFSIPGFSGHVYENVNGMLETRKILGLSAKDVKILRGVASKLAPLKGM